MAALRCRLPVGGYVPPASAKGSPEHSIGPDAQPNQHGMGGFLDLASGNYTPAADSDRAYIAGSHMWVPVTPQAIAPDGSSYVVTKLTADANHIIKSASLYLVDVRTRSERLLYTGGE